MKFAEITSPHQALTPDAEFLFVNVARWRTAEDFLEAGGVHAKQVIAG